jgi:hypothetical protein
MGIAMSEMKQATLESYLKSPEEISDYREASFAIEKAFTDYNEKRPHSSIDYLPPREFRMKFLDDQSFREDYTRKLEARINEK